MHGAHGKEDKMSTKLKPALSAALVVVPASVAGCDNRTPIFLNDPRQKSNDNRDVDHVGPSRCSSFGPGMPIVISQEDARQGLTDPNTLYVLGFGVAGATFASALLLAYFALSRSLG